MGEVYANTKNQVTFKSLQWKKETCSQTELIKYFIDDVHANREYGTNKKIEKEQEIGVWLKKEKDYISFNVIQHGGESWFIEFSGKLFSNKIELEIESPERKTDKDFLLGYFIKFGIKPVNLPNY